jgi:hypothetical protein
VPPALPLVVDRLDPPVLLSLLLSVGSSRALRGLPQGAIGIVQRLFE